MKLALILQSTYNSVEIGLFTQDEQYTRNEHKYTASKNLLTRIDELLEEAGLTKEQIDVIGVNRGPAPFTTLRSMITLANGIAHALNIPMVGIDGLHAMLSEHPSPAPTTNVCLYDAYGKDVYFGITQGENISSLKTGCIKLTNLLEELTAKSGAKYYCIGSGSITFADQLRQALGNRVTIAQDIPTHPSLEYLNARVQTELASGNTVNQVEPLYIKAATF